MAQCSQLKPEYWTLTVLCIRWVREEEHPFFLKGPSCYCRIHKLIVKVQVVYGQGHSAISASHHHATPAVVVVLVSDIDDNASVGHFERLQKSKRSKLVKLFGEQRSVLFHTSS